MTENRPLGVRLIALYFFLKSAILIVTAVTAHIRPELESKANEFISHIVASVQDFDLLSFAVTLAPLYALFYAVLGLGVWFLKRWARLLILMNLLYGLGGAAVGLAILIFSNPKALSSLGSNPYLLVGLVVGLLVLRCLLDPDVERAFGVRQ